MLDEEAVDEALEAVAVVAFVVVAAVAVEPEPDDAAVAVAPAVPLETVALVRAAVVVPPAALAA